MTLSESSSEFSTTAVLPKAGNAASPASTAAAAHSRKRPRTAGFVTNGWGAQNRNTRAAWDNNIGRSGIAAAVNLRHRERFAERKKPTRCGSRASREDISAV